MRPVDEVKPQIADQLAWEKASTKAADLAIGIEKEITKPADLDKVASARGLKVQESGFFTREEPILGLGPSPQAGAEAFSLKVGEVSGSIQVSRGYVFLTPVSVEAPKLPALDEVKDRVKEDVTKDKAKAIAREKAAALVASIGGTADLAKAAKAAGIEVKTTELLPRESPLPEIGTAPQVDAAAFSLPAGAIGGPIDTDNAVVVVKVDEHTQPTPLELAAARGQLKDDLTTERRERFFASYMQKVRQRIKIEVNRENLQKVIGG
jgi:hypothetical protein